MSTDAEVSAALKLQYYELCAEADCHVLDQMMDIIDYNHHNAVLNLSGNLPEYKIEKLTEADLWSLFRVLEKDVYTAQLDLSYNSIRESEAKILGWTLSKNKILQTLNLTMCDLRTRSIMPLCHALQFNGTLTKLVLHGNKLSALGGTELATALQINNTLEYLDISNTDQDTASLIAFFTVLHSNKTLKYIDLSSPKTIKRREELIVHACEALRENATLESLILRKHGISDPGASRIAWALRANSGLKHIDLSCNSINAHGAASFAELLIKNTPLEGLSLCSNEIGDEGIEAISETLATRNNTLRKLWVTNNSIHGSGLSSLAASLLTNTSLTHVYIWGNKLDDKACNAFEMLCTKGRLAAENTDVMPYRVDGVTYLAERGHYAFSH